MDKLDDQDRKLDPELNILLHLKEVEISGKCLSAGLEHFLKKITNIFSLL